MMMMEKKNQSYSRLNPRRDSISYLLLKITRQVKTRMFIIPLNLRRLKGKLFVKKDFLSVDTR